MKSKKDTLVCCHFSDGYIAYYLKGHAKDHIVAKPDETVTFTWDFNRCEKRRLKVKYSTWSKRLQKKDKSA